MIKVSVVMPIYNAKALAKYSIDSLLNQTLKEIEIIVVDDRSTDGSFAYYTDLYKEESRVTILEAEENKGPGKARTLGIAAAKGEYITFLDGDDGILPEALEKMYEEAKKWDADVVHTTGMMIPVADPMPDDLMTLPMDQLYPNNQDQYVPETTIKITEDPGEKLKQWMMHFYNGNVWGKLFKRRFLEENHIEFPEMKMMEDIIYSLHALLTAKTYVVMPKQFIIYRISNESTSRGKRDTAYVAKLLRVIMQTNTEMPKCLNSIPYFREHPEYQDALMKGMAAIGNVGYTGPAYQILGRQQIECDPQVRGVWKEFFGDHAQYVSDLWYQVMDALPPCPDMLGEYDTFVYWDEALRKRKRNLAHPVLVSIVVPMYNATDYILECVDALLRQTLKDIEIILVDDCSTDDTYEKCKEYYQKEEKVTVLRQEKNKGPGQARNRGIQAASGKYICFADSDDSYKPNAMEEMSAAAEASDADVLHVSGAYVTFARKLPKDLTTLPEDHLIKMMLDRENVGEMIEASPDRKERAEGWLRHGFHWNAWSKLFRREFLLENQIEFKNLSLAEDEMFCFRCLLLAQRYVKTTGYYYIYRNGVDSLSRGKVTIRSFARSLRSLLYVSDYLQETLDETGLQEYAKTILNNCTGNLDQNFVTPAYQQLTRLELEESEEITAIFRERYGAGYRLAEKMFFDAHDAIPVPEAPAPDMNTYAFWEEQQKKYGKGAVIQV